jgi:hypothetical protein
MEIFVFQIKLSLANQQTLNRNLQIAAPRAESGIVHRVVDAWIDL